MHEFDLPQIETIGAAQNLHKRFKRIAKNALKPKLTTEKTYLVRCKRFSRNNDFIEGIKNHRDSGEIELAVWKLVYGERLIVCQEKKAVRCCIGRITAFYWRVTENCCTEVHDTE